MAKEMNENEKLEMEMLQSVAGGHKGDWHTVMKCKACGFGIAWLGDYRRKGPYNCPSCHADKLYGTNNYYKA